MCVIKSLLVMCAQIYRPNLVPNSPNKPAKLRFDFELETHVWHKYPANKRIMPANGHNHAILAEISQKTPENRLNCPIFGHFDPFLGHFGQKTWESSNFCELTQKLVSKFTLNNSS